MEVFIANEQELPADETRLSALARHALSHEGVDEGELSILLVTAEHMRQLNARFAGDDHSTDVLSFPMMEDDEGDSMLLGDVVICPEVARDNSQHMNHRLQTELDVLLVHGTLHLLGYDHQTQEETADMDRRLRDIIDSFDPSST